MFPFTRLLFILQTIYILYQNISTLLVRLLNIFDIDFSVHLNTIGIELYWKHDRSSPIKLRLFLMIDQIVLRILVILNIMISNDLLFQFIDIMINLFTRWTIQLFLRLLINLTLLLFENIYIVHDLLVHQKYQFIVQNQIWYLQIIFYFVSQPIK